MWYQIEALNRGSSFKCSFDRFSGCHGYGSKDPRIYQKQRNFCNLCDTLHALEFVFKSVAIERFWEMCEILVSFMTYSVAEKVATVVDSMFIAKINYLPGFKFQNLPIRSTSLLLLS